MKHQTILARATDDELGAAVSENLYALFRSMQALPGGEVMEREGIGNHIEDLMGSPPGRVPLCGLVFITDGKFRVSTAGLPRGPLQDRNLYVRESLVAMTEDAK